MHQRQPPTTTKKLCVQQKLISKSCVSIPPLFSLLSFISFHSIWRQVTSLINSHSKSQDGLLHWTYYRMHACRCKSSQFSFKTYVSIILSSVIILCKSSLGTRSVPIFFLPKCQANNKRKCIQRTRSNCCGRAHRGTHTTNTYIIFVGL